MNNELWTLVFGLSRYTWASPFIHLMQAHNIHVAFLVERVATSYCVPRLEVWTFNPPSCSFCNSCVNRCAFLKLRHWQNFASILIINSTISRTVLSFLFFSPSSFSAHCSNFNFVLVNLYEYFTFPFGIWCDARGTNRLWGHEFYLSQHI